MDITTMRIVATLASMACFIGIWVWAYRGRNKSRGCPSSKIDLHQNENTP